MHEFRYGAFLKAFIFIFCPGLMALFIWALLQFGNQNPVVYFVVILPFSLGMIGLSLYGMADVAMGKFVIAGDRVILHSPFGSRGLSNDEIRGYRKDENHIRIFPVKESQKEMKVSTYFKDAHLIIQWLATHYNDLDILEGDEEERQVLRNDEFGITEESRLQRLNQARKVSKIVNGGVWVLLVWLLAFPRYYAYGITICCLYPLIAIFVTLSYRGLISPDEYKNSKIPSTGIAFILPGFILALRVLMDFTILMHPPWLWVAVVIISIVFSFLYILPSFRLTSKPIRFYATAFLMVLLNLFYSYGVIIAANCMLDNSVPAQYETTVSGKRVSTGKQTTYYLALNPWRTLAEAQEVKITRAEYESIQKGDSIVVTEHAGYLTIPWIEITPR
jgi:hypothetical protein